MNDQEGNDPGRNESAGRTRRMHRGRWAGAAGLLAAGALAGGIIASVGGASAATSSGSSSAASPSASAPQQSSTTAPDQSGTGQPGRPGPNAMSSSPVRSDEKSVSDSISATLKTKALAAVPGGTVYRIETDAGDAAYEAHMTKSDGALVTVKFDKSLNVTAVETGMGNGDPHPAGASGRA